MQAYNKDLSCLLMAHKTNMVEPCRLNFEFGKGWFFYSASVPGLCHVTENFYLAVFIFHSYYPTSRWIYSFSCKGEQLPILANLLGKALVKFPILIIQTKNSMNTWEYSKSCQAIIMMVQLACVMLLSNLGMKTAGSVSFCQPLVLVFLTTTLTTCI